MEEILEYYRRLKEALDKGEVFEERNYNHSHNAMVMRLMLEASSDIYMYCGAMSIFRKCFYNKIRECNEIMGDEIEAIMRNTLSEYLENKKGKLNIILQKYKTEYLEDLIVEKEVFLKRAKISALPDLPYEGYKESVKQVNHFSYTKDRKISRWEIDMVKHEAMVYIGDDRKITDVPVKIFKSLSQGAVPVY